MNNQPYIICILTITLLTTTLLILHHLTKQKQQHLIRSIITSEKEIKIHTNSDKWDMLSYLTLQDNNIIDNITSNDLDLKNIFARLNYCTSSLGEEYLIYLLHNPSFDPNELTNREKIISFYEKDDSRRIYAKSLYGQIGKSKYVSLFEYTDILLDASRKNIWKHIISLVDIPTCLLLMHFLGKWALVALVLSIIFNIATYFSDKGYYDCYTYPMTLLENIVKFQYAVPNEIASEMQNVSEGMNQNNSELRKLFRFSKIIYSKDFMAGDLAELFMDNIRMLTHIDIICFTYQLNKIKKAMPKIHEKMRILGYFESLLSIASFRKTLEYYCIPSLADDNKIEIEKVYHPLIAEPISNSVCIEDSILLTGSNASGKSTFLKTVALNQIMAQSICTCCARHFKGGLYRVVSSMALKDSLDKNESYYIAEINAMKRIIEIPESEKVFCFIDEILRGTNTVERIASAAHILKYLAEHNILCMAATHDIELTYLLEGIYQNYHFCESYEDGVIGFDYKLKSGRCENRNAIKLLDALGLAYEIIEGAERTAEYFEKNSNWCLEP